MYAIILALLPIFLTILAGAICRRFGFPDNAFWQPAARFTYYVFFPALIITRLATTDLTGIAFGAITIALVIPIGLIADSMLLLRPLFAVDNPAFTSLFQGSIRMNTYVGLAGAAALYGDLGLALAALVLMILIPLVNVLSVVVLTHYVGVQQLRLGSTLLAILRTPPVAACVLGILLNLTGVGLPPVLAELLEIAARAALPLGLLTVGAALDLRAVRGTGSAVLVVSALKLGLLPLLTAGACLMLGVSDEARAITILFAALPGAPAAYLLAQELGGDVRLMAAIVTVQTALAAFTIPLVAMLW